MSMSPPIGIARELLRSAGSRPDVRDENIEHQLVPMTRAISAIEVRP